MKNFISKEFFAKVIITSLALQSFNATLICKQKKECRDGIECIADYVIVGAGAGGSVLASRLAQAGNSVIIIEAGPDTSLESTNINVQCDKAGIAVPLLLASGWNRFNQCNESTNCGFWSATQTLSEFVSTEQNGIYYAYPRGCGAGGSVSHHALQDGIGSLQIYENIAKAIKDDYWRGENMQRLFKKMEKALFPNPTGDCGNDGWLSIIHSPTEPLSQDFTAAVLSTISTPYRENFCNPQDVAGIGNSSIQVTADGIRSYSYQDLLIPTMQQTGNIKVVFDTLAAEIILEKNKERCPNKYRAVGVKAYNKAYLQEVQPGAAFNIICPDPAGCEDPETCVALTTDQNFPAKATNYIARKEVIVCGGAIQTPQLLMLSGIGPKEHLESVGITPKLDLPGVGSDLLDHCEVSIIFEINPQVFVPSWIANILLASYPQDAFDPLVYERCVEAATNFPSFLNQNTASQQWDWFSNSPVNPIVVPGEKYPLPDVHTVPYSFFYTGFDLTLSSPQYPGNYFDFNRNNLLPDILDPINQKGLPIKKDVIDAQLNLNAEGKPRVYFTILIENLIPGNSNGTIRLASNDVRQSPIIREQLYEDDQGIERMAKMVLQVRNVADKLKDKYGIPGQPWEIFPGTVNPDVRTLEGLKQYIKNWQAYGHHMSGTCQMGARDPKTGKAENPRSVLDPRCRVFGVDNLRVADTSVYVAPWLHGFNTSRAGYVVGEAVAEFIINKL